MQDYKDHNVIFIAIISGISILMIYRVSDQMGQKRNDLIDSKSMIKYLIFSSIVIVIKDVFQELFENWFIPYLVEQGIDVKYKIMNIEVQLYLKYIVAINILVLLPYLLYINNLI